MSGFISLIARTFSDRNIVNGNINIVLVRCHRSEQYNEKIIHLAEGDLSPYPGGRIGRTSHDVDLARATVVRPGQDLKSCVAPI